MAWLRYMMRWQTYLLIAILAGLATLLYFAYSRVYTQPDLIMAWNGARYWLQGVEPYSPEATFLQTGSRSQTISGFPYPFPVVLLMVPFTLLPFPWAAAIWGLVSLLTVLALPLVFVPKPSPWLLGGMLLYLPFLAAIEEAQWAPILLMFAAISLYTWQRGRYHWSGFVLPLVLLKPQVGLALFGALLAFIWMQKPDRRWLQGLLAGFAVWWGLSLLFDPAWPAGWIGQLRRYSAEDQNSIELLSIVGALSCIAALAVLVIAWRRSDREVVLGALLLIGMLVLPSRSIYNQTIFLLPLVLLALRQPRAVMAAIVASWSILAFLLLRIDMVNSIALAFYVPLLAVLIRALYPVPSAGNIVWWPLRKA